MNGTKAQTQRTMQTTQSTAIPRNNQPADCRLDSWKEIAAYLNRSARCAQRWEKHLGLPVHRIRHSEGHALYAYASELEAWRQSREPADTTVDSGAAPGRMSIGPESHLARGFPRCCTPLFSLRRLLRKAVPLRMARS